MISRIVRVHIVATLIIIAASSPAQSSPPPAPDWMTTGMLQAVREHEQNPRSKETRVQRYLRELSELTYSNKKSYTGSLSLNEQFILNEALWKIHVGRLT